MDSAISDSGRYLDRLCSSIRCEWVISQCGPIQTRACRVRSVYKVPKDCQVPRCADAREVSQHATCRDAISETHRKGGRMGRMQIRLGSVQFGDETPLECLREQAAQGRLRDVSCDAEGCEYRLFKTERAHNSVRASSEGDCLLQLRLRARASPELWIGEWDFCVGMERPQT